MNFNEFKAACARARVSVQNVADEVGLSYEGIKRGIGNGSLSLRYVVPLCKSLGITPNQFFGVDSTNGIHQTQNGGVGNTQIVDQGIAALQEQLRVKDDQINKLLNIMSK